MNVIRICIVFVAFLIMFGGCSDNQQPAEEPPSPAQGPAQTEETAAPGDEAEKVEILATWTSDYPVEALDKIPAGQQAGPVGYIDDRETFSAVWEQFQPLTDVPDVDFEDQLVVFYRNVKFYNSTNIFEVALKDGVAEIKAMQTLSAIPIEDKVAMAMAVIPRKGIKAIKGHDDVVQLK